MTETISETNQDDRIRYDISSIKNFLASNPGLRTRLDEIAEASVSAAMATMAARVDILQTTFEKERKT